MTLPEILTKYPDEQFLKADGYDDAVIGLSKGKRLIYSQSKVLEILCQEMTYDEALEYFYFNIKDTYVGSKTPIWKYDL